MTGADIVRATGVSPQTVYAHLKNGKLRGHRRNGSHWYISPGDCLEWAWEMMDDGRCVMFPIEYIENFIQFFRLK